MKKPKKIGFWTCTALVVGNMVGTGIYLLPATLAPFAWNAIFGWLLTIAGALCLAWIFATLARHFPRSGGPYYFTRRAFGRGPAFMVAWSYWISIWAGNGAIAAGIVSYLTVFFPVLSAKPWLAPVICLALVWLLTLVNCLGIRVAGGVQLVTTLIKIVPLILVIGVAAAVLLFPPAQGYEWREFSAGDLQLSAIVAAATITLWPMLGLESATVPAESVSNPRRVIPLATMVGVGLTSALFLLSSAAVILMLPGETVANSPAPFSEFLSRYVNTQAAILLALFVAISGFGALNGWILLQGELPAAMARDGVFPRWIGERSVRGAPVNAHLVSSACLTVVVCMNYSSSLTDLFAFILLLSTTASLFMFFACIVAAWVLQRRGDMQASPAFLAVGFFALGYVLLAFAGTGSRAFLWGIVLLFLGWPVYVMMRRWSSNADQSFSEDVN